MNVPILRAAIHWHIDPPFRPDGEAMRSRVQSLGRMVGTQLRQAVDATGFAPQEVNVSGTIFASSLSDDSDNLACFYENVQVACGRRPSSISTIYQCSGWGFVLRFFLRHTKITKLAVLLVDVDLHNLQAARTHPVIGQSGFGVTTLLFELPHDRANSPTCSGPYPNSAYNQFMTALKMRQTKENSLQTFIPFMRQPFSQTAERVLSQTALGPNLNDELGHCFGADPWIGVIKTPDAAGCDRHIVAGSVGYKGYYTIADVVVRGDALLEFRGLEDNVI